MTQIGPHALWHGTGRAAAREAMDACTAHDIVVVNAWPEDPPAPLVAAEAETLARLTAPSPRSGAAAPGAANAQTPTDCLLLSPMVLSRTGAVALSYGPGGLQLDTARGHQGQRLWSPRMR